LKSDTPERNARQSGLVLSAQSKLNIALKAVNHEVPLWTGNCRLADFFDRCRSDHCPGLAVAQIATNASCCIQQQSQPVTVCLCQVVVSALILPLTAVQQFSNQCCHAAILKNAACDFHSCLSNSLFVVHCLHPLKKSHPEETPAVSGFVVSVISRRARTGNLSRNSF